MRNPTVQELIAAQGMPAGGMVRIPSEDEKREIARVQGMQVRTNAASMACSMLQHRQTSPATWARWAATIERYIMEGAGSDDAAPPILSRA